MTNEEKAFKAARVIKEEIGMSEHSIPRVAEIIDECLTWKTQQLIDKVCDEKVITSIAKAMLDSTISCKAKAELMRVILTKAMEE